jgi:hypothetical protein
MARGKQTARPDQRAENYKHSESTNPMRPDVGTQAQFKKKKPPVSYRYDSSLSPVLEWDGRNPARERGEVVISQILEAKSLEEAKRAGEQLKALSKPFLNWAGKAERISFDVPTLPLFVDERLSTKAIIDTLDALDVPARPPPARSGSTHAHDAGVATVVGARGSRKTALLRPTGSCTVRRLFDRGKGRLFAGHCGTPRRTKRRPEELTQNKVLVTNWHVYEPRGVQTGGVSAKVSKAGVPVRTREIINISSKTTTARGSRYLTLADLEKQVAAGLLTVLEEQRDRDGSLKKVKVESTRYVESDTSLINRVLGREVGGKKNILVFNDEAHHAYRIKRDEPEPGEEEEFGEEEEAEEFFQEAPSGSTDWIESTSIAASTSALIFLRHHISWVEPARRRTRHSHGWSAISGWWTLSSPDW